MPDTECTALPKAIHALAMLPPVSRARVQSAIRPPGILSVRLVPDQFVDAVERGWPDVAVLDPTLARGLGHIPAALRAARTPALLYVCVTPEHACAAMDFLRHLPLPVITVGYGDDIRALAEALRRTGRAYRGVALLEQLAPALERLPAHVVRGIDHANQSHSRLTTPRDLALYCGVHRRTLARIFTNARLWSVGRFVAALSLVRAYDVLSDASVPALSASRHLGLNLTRTLSARCQAASGLTLRQIRRGVPFGEFCTACAARLSQALSIATLPGWPGHPQ